MAMMATMAMAVAAVAAVAAAAPVMTEGHRLAVTTNQSDANDREEHRETQNNNTVHPQILQLLTGTVSETTDLPSTAKQARSRRLSVALAISPERSISSFAPGAVPVVKIYGLRRI
jgi:hypothetical protein